VQRCGGTTVRRCGGGAAVVVCGGAVCVAVRSAQNVREMYVETEMWRQRGDSLSPTNSTSRRL